MRRDISAEKSLVLLIGYAFNICSVIAGGGLSVIGYFCFGLGGINLYPCAESYITARRSDKYFENASFNVPILYVGIIVRKGTLAKSEGNLFFFT